LGEGVNLAARLQTMAEPGGILISRQVYDQVQKKLSVGFEYLGEKRPKNFAESVAVYSVAPSEGDVSLGKAGAKRKARAAAPSDAKARFIGQAQRYGVIWLALFAIDIATGSPYWSHWPALGMLLLLALRSKPLFEPKD
jgi:adenylate cyclase